jgi:adhesin/invasin
VKGRVVNFNLNDITGGRLTRSAVETNSFGEATTTYIAGSTSSASGGVVITASVAGNNPDNSSLPNPAEVKLTVAQRSVFVSVASGNVIQKTDGGTRYVLPHTVLVTDSNGTPVGNSEVTLSIWVENYIRPVHNDVGVTVGYALCKNEDQNRNGVLDPGEDADGSGRLEPGGVITVDNLRLTTDAAGFKDFNVMYAIQYATWLYNVELMARTSTAGSEATAIVPVRTPCLSDDVEDDTCPVNNPFGGVKPENFGGICATCRQEPDAEGNMVIVCD